MQPKPNTRAAVAIAMQTEDLSAFELITMAVGQRREDVQDLALRSYLRRASDLLRCEVWGEERDLPAWTDNVHQPYAPCYYSHPEYTLGAKVLVNPRDRKAQLAVGHTLRTMAEDDRPPAIRPKQVGNLFTLTHEEASSLGQMAWLAGE